MPDLDASFVRSLVMGGPPSLRRAMERVQPSDLAADGPGRKAYDFVLGYYKAHHKLPSFPLIHFETGVNLDGPDAAETVVDGDPNHFLGKVLEARLRLALQTGVPKILEQAQNNPNAALESLAALTREIRKNHTAGSTISYFPDVARLAWEHYLEKESGKTGILFPWARANDSTLGLWPQDLALFVARMGTGKSWAAALIIRQAWKAGHRVLLATTEMLPRTMAGRVLCIEHAVPYTDWVRGKLSPFARAKLEKGIQNLVQGDQFAFIGGDFDFRLDAFEAAIDEASPDLVLLDGAYLLRVEGKTRSEKAANAFDELKRLAARLKKPIVVTMQFNREVKSNDAASVKAESIALTDVAGWNADMIFGMIRTEEMIAEKRLRIKPLKTREGEAEDFDIRWDFLAMDFTEIPKGSGDVEEVFAPDPKTAPQTNEEPPF